MKVLIWEDSAERRGKATELKEDVQFQFILKVTLAVIETEVLVRERVMFLSKAGARRNRAIW